MHWEVINKGMRVLWLMGPNYVQEAVNQGDFILAYGIHFQGLCQVWIDKKNPKFVTTINSTHEETQMPYQGFRSIKPMINVLVTEPSQLPFCKISAWYNNDSKIISPVSQQKLSILHMHTS